jgi:hypothetical protein
MLGKIASKLRMPDGSINPWVIAVTVTLATFEKAQGAPVHWDCNVSVTFLC